MIFARKNRKKNGNALVAGIQKHKKDPDIVPLPGPSCVKTMTLI